MGRSRLLGGVGAALILASCGGSSGSSSATTATSPSAAPQTTSSAAQTTATTPARAAQDQALAKRASFRLSDFPPGWRTDSADRSPPACGIYDGLNQTAQAAYAFTQQDQASADSRVRVFATEGDARAAMSRLLSAKLRSCYAEAVKTRTSQSKEVKSGEMQVGDVKIGELSSERYGDQSGALEIVLPITQSSVETDVYSDTLFVRVGRTLLIGNFLSQDASPDQDLMSRLMRAASARLSPSGG